MFLGTNREGLVTIAQIARAYQISENHLMKVVHQLGKAGYIETVRGKGGGMRLAREPAAIQIGEVVRQTENDLFLVECMAPSSGCHIQPECRIKGVMSEALEAMFTVLNRYSLADLLDRKLTQVLAGV